ncbi:MAG: tetratricopeptide repeat protein [Pseudomonadota bacterium]
MKHLLLTASLVLPFAATTAFAAGGGDEKAPSKPKCKNGQIYDKATKACVNAEESNLDVDSLYENVRELAYANRFKDAQIVLAQMPQDDDRTLTYLGFTNRKMGKMDAAMDYYREALRINPANVLARSYMGQGFVTLGLVDKAKAQLDEIRAYGGAGTWAEASLQSAIETGRTYNY